MARKTLRLVIGWRRLGIAMGVVARHAAQGPAALSVATAPFERRPGKARPVGSGARGGHLQEMLAVALAAGVIDLRGRSPRRAGDGPVRELDRDRCQMKAARSMAPLTADRPVVGLGTCPLARRADWSRDKPNTPAARRPTRIARPRTRHLASDAPLDPSSGPTPILRNSDDTRGAKYELARVRHVRSMTYSGHLNRARSRPLPA